MGLSQHFATLHIFPADQFNCTYAQLMMSIAASDLGVNVPLNDTTKKTAGDYIEICRLGAELDSLSSDSISLRTKAKEVLEKLASYPTKSNDASSRELKDSAAPIFAESENLDQAERALKTNYAEARKEAMISLANIFRTITNAPNPEEQSKSQVTQHELQKVENRRMELKKLIDQFVKHRQRNNLQIYGVYSKGYNLLTTLDQASMPPPASQAPTPVVKSKL